jgi:hypothetical protein
MATSSLRWGRILLGGFLAEVLLIAAVIPVYAAGGNESIITAIGVGGSFLVFLPVAWWLGRTIERPILHGVLMGIAATVIYLVMTMIGRVLDPNAPPMPLVYYVGHALKLAGGAAGGWLAERSAARGPQSVARASLRL